MVELILLIAAVVLLIVLLILTILRGKPDFSGVQERIGQTEGTLRDELGRNRQEFNSASRDLRQELTDSSVKLADTLLKRLSESLEQQKNQFETFAGFLEKLGSGLQGRLEEFKGDLNERLQQSDRLITERLEAIRKENQEALQTSREESERTLNTFRQSFVNQLQEMDKLQKEKLESITQELSKLTAASEEKLERMRGTIDGKLKQMGEENQKGMGVMRAENEKGMTAIRKENQEALQTSREESERTLKSFRDSFVNQLQEMDKLQKAKLESITQELSKLTASSEEKLERMRGTIDGKLKQIGEENAQRLEKMRETVDEKLHATLEKRLGDSFKLVSERLELVHKGLGEMHHLASGVGDLKRVLTNVKTRGVLGEVQLENILEQILTFDQYERNVKTRQDSDAMVEFAIKLPGRDKDDSVVWLPIDAKFPTEDYQSLRDAYEQADTGLIEQFRKQLAKRIEQSAKDIRDKYLDPPNTTSFALMFLPVEGLYAEVLQTGQFQQIQRDFKVIITGPTTLTAIINSLRLGFQTLAIEKRSSEVWDVLAAVKTEFGKFGDVLKKTSKKLQEASNHIDSASRRTRVMQRKLKDVAQLPVQQAQQMLGTPVDESGEVEEEDSD